MTSMTSVAGTTVYSLDAARRRTRVATPSAAFDFGYCGWNGLLAAVTNASGFVVQYAYDVMDRVTNISWRTTGGATLGGFAYEYDAVGRITSRHQLPRSPRCVIASNAANGRRQLASSTSVCAGTIPRREGGFPKIR